MTFRPSILALALVAAAAARAAEEPGTAAERPGGESAPVAERPNAEAAPVAERPNAEAAPAAERPNAEAAPVAEAEDAADGRATPSPDDEGHFLGDRYRWAEMNVVSRALYDVIAIPANVGRWDGKDWVQAAFWTAAVTVPWFAGDPPVDLQVNRWAYEVVNPHVPTVWTPVMQPVLWGTIAVGGLGTWWWASATGHDDIAQGISLMGEALAVTQAYHITLKLLIGRDGPRNGDGTGQVKGPANALHVYPAGTPSGHSATLFTLASSGFAYFRPPIWVQAIGYLAVGSLVAFHVIDHRHFFSESIWGAAMGWHVGQWVVRHRASWLYGERRPGVRVTVAPAPVGGAPGFALVGSF